MLISAKNRLGSSSQQGMTLIELLISLSIISLCALLSASAINKALPQRAVDFTAENLVSDLKQARLKAQRTGVPVLVTISEHNYSAPGVFTRTLNNGVTAHFEDGAGNILFHRSFANHGGVITLSKSDRRAIVLIHTLTGKIERIE